MTTPLMMCEQIMRLYYGGDVPDDAELDIREVRLLLNQLVNRRLKLTRMESISEGDRDIPACMISEFEDIAVEQSQRTKQYFAKLPVSPISLPRNMGIWEVFESENPYNQFIPLSPGDMTILRGLPANELEGMIGYQPQNDRIVFTKEMNQIKLVTMRLLVSDVDKLGDMEVLPIPAEMEPAILEDAFKMLSVRNRRTDNYNDSQDTVGK